MRIPRVPFDYAVFVPFNVNRLVGTCEPVYCSSDNCYMVKILACIAIIGLFCVYVLVNCYQMKNVCIAINNGGIHVLVNCYQMKNVCITINNGGIHVLVNCYLMKNVCIAINNGGFHVLVNCYLTKNVRISINNGGNCYRTKNVRIAIAILCRPVCLLNNCHRTKNNARMTIIDPPSVLELKCFTLTCLISPLPEYLNLAGAKEPPNPDSKVPLAICNGPLLHLPYNGSLSLT